MLLGIAWRNIWRSKKRSFVIVVAIALGLAGGLFAAGMMSGMAEAMVNAAIDRSLSHLQIHTPAFKANAVINYTIPDPGPLVDSIRSLPAVEAVSARAVINGIASSATSNARIEILAVTPPDEAAVSSLARSIVEGGYFGNGDRNAILIGAKLAETLRIHLRSKIILSFPRADGSIVYGAFHIKGIFRTQSSLFDGGNVFIRQDDLAALLEGRYVVHEIAVRLRSAESLPATLTSVRLMAPGLRVESWKELAPEMKLTAELTDVEMLIFLGIILFALLFGITNTMLMSVMERVKEIGVLMAVGMKRKRVFSLILLETILLSLSGGAIGVAAGALLIGIFGSVGINLSMFAEGLAVYGMGSMVYTRIPWEMYPQLGVLVIITALLAAVYPGLKATRLSPAAAIRV